MFAQKRASAISGCEIEDDDEHVDSQVGVDQMINPAIEGGTFKMKAHNYSDPMKQNQLMNSSSAKRGMQWMNQASGIDANSLYP